MTDRFYIPAGMTKDEADKIRHDNTCAVCGGELQYYNEGYPRGSQVFHEDPQHPQYLACRFSHLYGGHEGIARKYQEPNEMIEHHRMEDYMGTTAMARIDQELARRNLPVTGVIQSFEAAMQVCRVYWPDAPDEHIKAAAYVCSDFGLHPGAKHIYLVNYGGKWERLLSIGAKRLIAQKVKHAKYSYIDFTPRIMSEEEERKIYGKVNPEKVRAITILQTADGQTVYGAGEINRAAKIQGEDKGNSLENMAMIHSESRALDRLPGGEVSIPKFEIIDEQYIDMPSGTVDTTTGEIISKPEPESDENEIEGEFHEAESEQASEAVRTGDEPASDQCQTGDQKPPRDKSTVKNLGDLYNACREDWPSEFGGKKNTSKLVCADLGVSDPSMITDTPWECYQRIAAVRK